MYLHKYVLKIETDMTQGSSRDNKENLHKNVNRPCHSINMGHLKRRQSSFK